MNKSCLVIGAGGFIGFNLCLELIGKYQQIHACDTFFPKNILQQFKKNKIEIIEGGVEGFLIAQQDYRHIDDIFYFAGNSVPALVEIELERGCFSDQETLVMMLSSLKNMENKIRFVYGSSGGTVYGLTPHEPCKESVLCQPISAYGLSKYIQEQYIQFYAKKLGFDYYITRISNPYGRLRSHGSKNLQGFIDNVIDKAAKNQPIQIWGDGSVVRDFIHISDLSTAISSLTSSKIPAGIYNIGSGQATSLNDIITILESFAKNIKVTRLEARTIDVAFNVLNINKIHVATRWNPKKSIEDEFKRILNP
jgi:UDP-glucose 4-epimerase